MLTSKEVLHQDMRLSLSPIGGENWGICGLSPLTGKAGQTPFPPFQLMLAGAPLCNAYGFNSGNGDLPLGARCLEIQDTLEALTFRYECGPGLVVTCVLEKLPQGVFRQVNRVENRGTEPVVLQQFASAMVCGIAAGGLMSWNDDRKIRIHYCYNPWEAEGQWRTLSLAEAGVCQTSSHTVPASFDLSSCGTWSTGRNLPMVLVEDLETKEIWFAEMETSASWHLEIGVRKAGENWRGDLFMMAGAADERYTHFYKTLRPGESFASQPVVYGCAAGGFEQAVRKLTGYRRARKPKDPWSCQGTPLVYNDYMNTLWGDPMIQRLRPLAQKAAQAGAEVFCVDAGWFGMPGKSWGCGLGDWEPCDGRFGPEGFQGFVDYVRGLGMVPGFWLEIDACHEESKLYQKPDSWFLCRQGRRIGGGRALLDFRNPEVRAHIAGRIDALVAMGIGYFKNDFNQNSGVGADGGECGLETLWENLDCYYAMLDQVRAKHPGLIIENCGSGAMRSDLAAHQHFHLQSTSDLETYTMYPAVISGLGANLLPEQMGIWSYPIPLLITQKKPEEAARLPLALTAPEYREAMADGEQTAFNMVNGLCGAMYLSGNLDGADEKNLALVREGCRVYKEIRKETHQGDPVWPTGRARINRQDFVTYGILSKDRRVLYLAVWRLEGAEDTLSIDLSPWAGPGCSASLLYPAALGGEEFCCNPSGRTFSVKLEKRNSGRFFRIQL